MPKRLHGSDILVIADDFTGANDAGVGLSRYGARVNVLFGGLGAHTLDQADAWAVNTESRALPAPEAARRVAQMVYQWRALTDGGWIYKKIDSTLRGNLGAEIEAALTASGATLAIIAPATPAMGRQMLDGNCVLHGVALEHTEFASDPSTPVLTSSIADIIKQQSALPLAGLNLPAVRAADLAQRLQDLAAQGQRLVVLDSESDEDLRCITKALLALPFRPLLVGSAGLIEMLAQRLCFQRVDPLLAIVGSMSETAQRQIAHALDQSRITLVDIDVLQAFADHHTLFNARWVTQVTSVLAAGRHCVVRTCRDAGQRQHIEAFCLRHAVSRQELGEKICQMLGQLVQQILTQQPIGGLYLTGGDVAIAVAHALGATGFQLRGQIADCVPYGRLLNSAAGNIPVMTKAGGFGSETTLVAVIRFIEEKLRD